MYVYVCVENQVKGHKPNIHSNYHFIIVVWLFLICTIRPSVYFALSLSLPFTCESEQWNAKMKTIVQCAMSASTCCWCKEKRSWQEKDCARSGIWNAARAGPTSTFAVSLYRNLCFVHKNNYCVLSCSLCRVTAAAAAPIHISLLLHPKKKNRKLHSKSVYVRTTQRNTHIMP